MSTRKRGKPRKSSKGKRVAKRRDKVAGRAESSPASAPSAAAYEIVESLTPKQERFSQEYLVDLNGTQAAIRAGYSKGTAGEIAYENLKKPEIQRLVAKLMEERAVRTRITKDRVLSGISEMASYDIADAFTESGAVKAIHDMPPQLRNAIAGIEVQELNIDGRPVGAIKKIKLIDRVRPHELLGRHLKLFTDKIEVNDKTGLGERLHKARTRARASD